MLHFKKKAAIILLALSASLGFTNNASAQDMNGLWHAAPAYAETHGQPVLHPDHYSAFTADEGGLRAYLESSAKTYAAAGSIALPRPEGGYRSFRIWATSMMESELALKYPEITTYTAEAEDNHNVTAKIDYSPLFGMHAMVYDGGSSYLIDPYTGKAGGAYIAYYKHDYSRALNALMPCLNDKEQRMSIPTTAGGALVNGTIRRTYRLALAADSEYCIAVVGANPTKAAVLAKMVVSMNRVNGIYEREFALTMVLVAKEDTLIFNTTAPDPYTNSNQYTMLDSNQATVTRRIGAANYDIGHVFTTSSGGVASLGCVCQGSQKARGVTGTSNPVGDAYDVDYVAHEMGHQYGGSHTFNVNTGSCSGNGNQNTSMEPGSGSTIMAYAGICGSGDNLQSHSDPYFHSASLEEITANISTSGACASITPSTNTNAVVPSYSASYNIPFKTPFELTAPTATDATKDTLTYCWEQRNTGGADFGKSLATTTTDGPLFRSFLPTTSQTRSFPTLRRLIIGPTATTPGEKEPDVTRSMKFQFTERDIYQGWGAFNFSGDAVTLNATSVSGPFVVNLPAGGETWTGGSMQTITWDVANTTAAPVSCSKVDIQLSVDGGLTYPFTLATGTPNDGSETVRMANPSADVSSARIKVKGNGNVFFNINPYDFNLNRGSTGVQTLSADAVSLSPVPADDELHIVIPASEGALDAQLVNTLGQTAWSGLLKGNASIAVGQLPRGVYYLRLLASGGTVITKTAVLR